MAACSSTDLVLLGYPQVRRFAGLLVSLGCSACSFRSSNLGPVLRDSIIPIGIA